MPTPTVKQEQQLEWNELWRRTNWNSDSVFFGVDFAITNGTKYYRAWSWTGEGGGNQRFYSDVYEACDAADANHESGYGFNMALRGHVETQAAVARALMTERQKSPEDMKQIADQLRIQAANAYQKFQEDEAIQRQVELTEKQARAVARQMLHGLALIRESGTPEEKALLDRVFPQKGM